MSKQVTKLDSRKEAKNRNLQIIEVLRERMERNRMYHRDMEELICSTGQVVVKKEE